MDIVTFIALALVTTALLPGLFFISATIPFVQDFHKGYTNPLAMENIIKNQKERAANKPFCKYFYFMWRPIEKPYYKVFQGVPEEKWQKLIYFYDNLYGYNEKKEP